MKSKLYFIVPALIFSLLPGLSHSQTWKSVKSIPAVRDGAISFSIGSYGFCGGGGEMQDDFWKYNPKTNAWTQLANIPGVKEGRGFAVGVADGKYGYVGFGQDSASQTAVTRDWWRYDTATNKWTQKAMFPGYTRDAAGVFAINGTIYVFGGVDSAFEYLSDCWAYDTGADKWTLVGLMPDWIAFPSTFVINGKGYFTCYVSGTNGLESTDLYVFDPNAKTWTTKASFPGAPRQAGTAFVLNNVAYVGLGQSQYTTVYNDFYSYTPGTDTWISVPNFGGGLRAWPCAFAIGNNGYVGTGSYVSGISLVTTADWWQYVPTSLSVNELSNAGDFICYPMPAKNIVTIENTLHNNNEDLNYSVYNMAGQLMDAGKLANNNSKYTLNVSELSNGEYFLCLKGDNITMVSKKIVVMQ